MLHYYDFTNHFFAKFEQKTIRNELSAWFRIVVPHETDEGIIPWENP